MAQGKTWTYGESLFIGVCVSLLVMLTWQIGQGALRGTDVRVPAALAGAVVVVLVATVVWYRRRVRACGLGGEAHSPELAALERKLTQGAVSPVALAFVVGLCFVGAMNAPTEKAAITFSILGVGSALGCAHILRGFLKLQRVLARKALDLSVTPEEQALLRPKGSAHRTGGEG
jgi:hypothetical protein